MEYQRISIINILFIQAARVFYPQPGVADSTSLAGRPALRLSHQADLLPLIQQRSFDTRGFAAQPDSRILVYDSALPNDTTHAQ